MAALSRRGVGGDAKAGLDEQADRRTDKTDTDGPTRRTQADTTDQAGRHLHAARDSLAARLGEGDRRWAPGRARTCEAQALDCQRGKAGVKLVTLLRCELAAAQ